MGKKGRNKGKAKKNASAAGTGRGVKAGAEEEEAEFLQQHDQMVADAEGSEEKPGLGGLRREGKPPLQHQPALAK